MTPMKRLATVGGTAALAIGLLATAASADELTDYLDRAQESTYTANRLVVSVWGDQTQVSTSFVEHSNGMEMVRVDTTWTMVGNGRSVTVNDSPQGVAFVTHAEPIDTGRYTIGDVVNVKHMRRDCQIVQVLEDGKLRASILIDVRTGAPLITETFTDSGNVFRRSSLQDFKAYRTYAAPKDTRDFEYEIVMPVESEVLPRLMAGYQLVGIFPAPGGAEQGFYSDGLFSFSLFTFSDTASVSGFETPGTMVTEDGTYDVVATARDVRIYWTDGSYDYVIVGDMPPDHAVEILAELPSPDTRSMFSRWWDRVFG